MDMFLKQITVCIYLVSGKVCGSVNCKSFLRIKNINLVTNIIRTSYKDVTTFLSVQVIRDHQLALFVLCLVLVDISILILWQALDPFEAKLVEIKEEVSLYIHILSTAFDHETIQSIC